MKKRYLFLLLASTILANNVVAKDLLLPDPSDNNLIQNEDIIIDYSIIEELQNTPTTIKVNGRELLLPNPKIKKQEFKMPKAKKAIKKKVVKKAKPKNIIKKIAPKKVIKNDVIKVKEKVDIKASENLVIKNEVIKAPNKTKNVVITPEVKNVKTIKTPEVKKEIVEKAPIAVKNEVKETVKSEKTKPISLLKNNKNKFDNKNADEAQEEENVTELFFKGEEVTLSNKIIDIINSTIKGIEPSDNVKITISAYNRKDVNSDVFKNRRLCFDRVIAIRHYLNEFGFENFKVKVISTDNIEKETGLVDLKLEIKE